VDRPVGDEDLGPARLARVERAYWTTWERLCAARTVEDAEDELSNLLCQLYRAGEVAKKRLGKDEFYAALKTSPELGRAHTLMWLRQFDTHEAVVVAQPQDTFGGFFTGMFGTLVWRPLCDFGHPVGKYSRHEEHGELAGREVLSTVQEAFEALERLTVKGPDPEGGVRRRG
jgi:hypothetical protein